MRRLALAALAVTLLAAGVWWLLPRRHPAGDATTATPPTPTSASSTDIATTVAGTTVALHGPATTITRDIVTIPTPPIPTADRFGVDAHHTDDETAADPADVDVAVGWALERYRATWDPAALPRGALLAAWSRDGTLVDAATDGPPHIDTAAHETVSAVVVDTVGLGGRWWQIRLAVKTTRDGQTGVATTTADVTVHVTDTGVDADQDLPRS